MLIAEVTVTGSMKEATPNAFRQVGEGRCRRG
jgi:hypothetical protein